MAIETAQRDPNYVTTLMGVDMTTGEIPTNIYVDETTHRLLVSAVITGTTTTKYNTKIDDTTTAGVIYIGNAVPTGAAISGASAVWQIQKMDTNTLALDVTWADGDILFNNIWDNRASLTYN